MENKKIKYIALGTLALGTTIAIASAQVKSRNDVIEHLEIKKYIGKWFEIARVDNKFEKGLSDVTAEYQLQKDGTIKVINSGFSKKKNKRNQAIGKAKFTSKENNGGLKVSFFSVKKSSIGFKINPQLSLAIVQFLIDAFSIM